MILGYASFLTFLYRLVSDKSPHMHSGKYAELPKLGKRTLDSNMVWLQTFETLGCYYLININEGKLLNINEGYQPLRTRRTRCRCLCDASSVTSARRVCRKAGGSTRGVSVLT